MGHICGSGRTPSRHVVVRGSVGIPEAIALIMTRAYLLTILTNASGTIQENMSRKLTIIALLAGRCGLRIVMIFVTE